MRKSEALRLCLAVYKVKEHALASTSHVRDQRAIRLTCDMLAQQLLAEIYRGESFLDSCLGQGRVKIARSILEDAVHHGIIPPKQEG